MGLFDGITKVIDDSLFKPKRYRCCECGSYFRALIGLAVKCPKCGSSSIIEDKPWWEDSIVHQVWKTEKVLFNETIGKKAKYHSCKRICETVPR